jgi:integrase
LEKDLLRRQKADQERGERDFVAYFAAVADKRKGSNYDNWVSALAYLKDYTGGSLKFSDLSRQWRYDFRDYLTTAKSLKRELTLSTNTAVSYFNKFKACLKQAYKDGLLTEDLNARLEGIRPKEPRRQFLTIEELNSLAKTECVIPVIKLAALFSAMTGLRHSDIQKLVWSEVGRDGTGYYLQFRQQKTGGTEVTPISEQAFSLLGEHREGSAKVFEGLSYSAYHNRALYTWLGAAGITKHITFHCFRHTYATLLLSKGASMATVSKILGHRELKTTKIYAKVIDQSKREAAEMIKIEL